MAFLETTVSQLVAGVTSLWQFLASAWRAAESAYSYPLTFVLVLRAVAHAWELTESIVRRANSYDKAVYVPFWVIVSLVAQDDGYATQFLKLWRALRIIHIITFIILFFFPSRVYILIAIAHILLIDTRIYWDYRWFLQKKRPLDAEFVVYTVKIAKRYLVGLSAFTAMILLLMITPGDSGSLLDSIVGYGIALPMIPLAAYAIIASLVWDFRLFMSGTTLLEGPKDEMQGP